MTEIEPSIGSNREESRSILEQWRIVKGMVWKEIRELFSSPKILHPEFRIAWKIDDTLTWYQNRHWGPLPEPPFKIGFYFKDLSILDHCPWIVKFGSNLNPAFADFPYFCVGYGNPAHFDQGYDLDAMIEWAKQFHHPTLMTYAGKAVKDLGGKTA